MASKDAMANVVLLGIIAAASVLPAAVADAVFVASTCKSANNNPQCVAVLGTDPRSARATTVRELASIALDIAVANAVNSAKYLAGEAGRSRDPGEGGALGECVRKYRIALSQLAAARDAFNKGEYEEAEHQIGDAEYAGERCEQAFARRHVKSLVSDVDKRMKDWTSVAGDLFVYLLFADAKAKRSGRRLLRA